MNQATLTGNLGRDPEMNYTQTGKAVCKFSLAVSEGKDKTQWFNIVAWDKTAEYANEYLHKGSKVLVTGRIDQREYTDKAGIKRLAVDIVAGHIENLTPKPAAVPAGHTDEDPLGDLDEHPF